MLHKRNILKYPHRFQCSLMCFYLPETCPCRCHDCTPQPPCGFWTECMRCCVDLYSSQAERYRRTVTEQVKYLVLENTRSQTTTNASSEYKKRNSLLFYSSLPGESYSAMCQRLTRNYTAKKECLCFRCTGKSSKPSFFVLTAFGAIFVLP